MYSTILPTQHFKANIFISFQDTACIMVEGGKQSQYEKLRYGEKDEGWKSKWTRRGGCDRKNDRAPPPEGLDFVYVLGELGSLVRLSIGM